MADDRMRMLADPQAERAVLAAALLDAEGAVRVIPRIASIVTPSDFHDPRHATLWESFLAIHARGEQVDVLTVVAELRARDRLNTVGGAQYVGELTDEIPTMAHCESHARIVLDLAQRRRALEAFHTASARLAAGDPLAAVQSDVSRTLTQGTNAPGAGRVADDIDALIDAFHARREGREQPLATPWQSVNARLGGGLWPGMYVLVGGTGAGKTQWAVQVAVEAAQTGARVLYLALELSRQDLAARVLGVLAGVPWSGILRGRLDDTAVQRVSDAERLARVLPMHTECGVPFGYGADTLAARAWSLRPSLVVLDYLQLCSGRAGEDPRTTVGRVSYVARTLARDLGTAVLVLSSTARANYGELVNDPSRDPSDLVGLGKESGEIEYAADGVLVLARHTEPLPDVASPRDSSPPKPRGHRPMPASARPVTPSSTRALVVAKNRHGPLGRVELNWNGTAFFEGDAPYQPDEGGMDL